MIQTETEWLEDFEEEAFILWAESQRLVEGGAE